MNLLIVTGLSGAGKSLAMHALEDIGFFCIDNIPANLLAKLMEFARRVKIRWSAWLLCWTSGAENPPRIF